MSIQWGHLCCINTWIGEEAKCSTICQHDPRNLRHLSLATSFHLLLPAQFLFLCLISQLEGSLSQNSASLLALQLHGRKPVFCQCIPSAVIQHGCIYHTQRVCRSNRGSEKGCGGVLNRTQATREGLQIPTQHKHTVLVGIGPSSRAHLQSLRNAPHQQTHPICRPLALAHGNSRSHTTAALLMFTHTIFLSFAKSRNSGLQ